MRKKLHWVPIRGKIEGTIWAGPPGDLIAAAAQLITDEKEVSSVVANVYFCAMQLVADQYFTIHRRLTAAATPRSVALPAVRASVHPDARAAEEEGQSEGQRRHHTAGGPEEGHERGHRARQAEDAH